MNREIKFRAWDKEAKRMVFGGVVNFCEPLQDISMPLGELHKHTVAVHPSRGYALMQFTGLHDKNGREIYEGDIVKSDGGAVWEVVYDAPAFRMKERMNSLNIVKSIAAKQEVIGNIYENKELLK